MATDTVQLLNRIIALHASSLPVFAADAAPFSSTSDDHARDVLDMIAADHQLTVSKLAEVVIDRGGAVAQCGFPAGFTAYHDLSLNFLIGKMAQRQKNDVATIEKVAAKLTGDNEAHALIEEALGAAKGHLQSLEELAHAATAG